MSFIKSTLKPFQTILAPTVKTSNVQFYKKPSAGNGLGSAINAPFTRSGAGRKVIDASGNLVDAAANLPAWTFPIGGSSAGCPYLSFLPSVENLLTYSEDLSNAVWSKINSTISADATTSPDGTANADKLQSDATASQSVIAGRSFTVTASTDYTYVFFAKADEAEFIQVYFGTGQVTGNARGNFDLVNGVKGTIDAGIIDSNITLVNGFYCISVTVNTLSTTLQPFVNLIQSLTDARGAANSWNVGDGAFIWGAMLKEGSYISPLDYIPTTSAAVTRQVDQISNINDLQGAGYLTSQTEGAIILQFELVALRESLTQNRFLFEDSAGGDVVGFRISPSQLDLYNFLDATIMKTVTTESEPSGFVKVVYNWSDTSFELFYNGFSEYSYNHSSAIQIARFVNLLCNGGDSISFKQIAFAPLPLTPTEAEAASSWPSASLMISDLGYTLA